MPPDRVESFGEVGIKLRHLEEALQQQGVHLSSELNAIKVQLGHIESEIKKDFVRKETFEARLRPVEWIAYGMVVLLLTAIVTAIVSGVLK
jgi:hypothetical protein